LNDDERYSFYLYSTTARYSVPPDFRHRSELPSKGFASVYAVDEATAKAINSAGTTRKYAGVVWNQVLWLDIDSYTGAETVERRLREMELEYVAFDSGGRGAHFAITRHCSASHRLPEQDKKWVKNHFPEADTSIYTHLHPFRLSGSIHERTGRRKEVVSRGEGKALVLPKETEKVNETTVDRDFSSSLVEGSIFSNRRIMSFTKAYTEGDRHRGLNRLAYILKDCGYSKELCFWWLLETDKISECPKGELGVLEAMRSVYE
jgi:hypothetical protein